MPKEEEEAVALSWPERANKWLGIIINNHPFEAGNGGLPKPSVLQFCVIVTSSPLKQIEISQAKFKSF